MKYRSVFDIIGPIMVGPSSSHTAGAVRIGLIAHSLFETQPTDIQIYLYGSFKDTYRGHGTDVALVAGILGFDTNDTRIPDSLVIAKDLGIHITFKEMQETREHPNTAGIFLKDNIGNTLEVEGISIGGGKIEITKLNGFEINMSGSSPALLVFHNDKFGAISHVTKVLSDYQLNIGAMQMSRHEKGKIALMTIELDEEIPASAIEKINQLDGILKVTTMKDV